ncbi:hypothetical protein OG21DRAFT_1511153 [Imleria badia]|nr:hypothetical protein OG21DRAFT_1511153 [Imleria badia]
MDTGRLPAYRSSYLLRFHPYPRVKPSTRERIVAEARQYESYELLQINSLHLESDISFTLNQAIHGTGVHHKLRQRRLSVSSLVVDLALVFTKKLSLQDD